jgi:hypothetical protein
MTSLKISNIISEHCGNQIYGCKFRFFLCPYANVQPNYHLDVFIGLYYVSPLSNELHVTICAERKLFTKVECEEIESEANDEEEFASVADEVKVLKRTVEPRRKS